MVLAYRKINLTNILYLLQGACHGVYYAAFYQEPRYSISFHQMILIFSFYHFTIQKGVRGEVDVKISLLMLAAVYLALGFLCETRALYYLLFAAWSLQSIFIVSFRKKQLYYLLQCNLFGVLLFLFCLTCVNSQVLPLQLQKDSFAACVGLFTFIMGTMFIDIYLESSKQTGVAHKLIPYVHLGYLILSLFIFSSPVFGHLTNVFKELGILILCYLFLLALFSRVKKHRIIYTSWCLGLLLTTVTFIFFHVYN